MSGIEFTDPVDRRTRCVLQFPPGSGVTKILNVVRFGKLYIRTDAGLYRLRDWESGAVRKIVKPTRDLLKRLGEA